MHEAGEAAVPRQRVRKPLAVGRLPDSELEALVSNWTRDAFADQLGWTVPDDAANVVRTRLDALIHLIFQDDNVHDGVNAAARRLGASLADLFEASPHAFEKAQHEFLTFIGRRDSGQMLLIDVATAFAMGFATRSRAIVLFEHGYLSAPALEATGQAQRALDEDELRFRDEVDASADALCLCDLKGTLLTANRSLLDMIGYDLEQFLEQSPDALIAPPSARVVQELGRLLTGHRENVEFETKVRHADGHFLDVHLSKTLVREQGGAPGYTVTLVRDITVRKRSEAHMRQTRQQIQDVIKNSSDVIAVTSEHGVIEFLSPAVQHVLGHQPDSLLGKTLTHLLSNNDRASSAIALDEIRDRPGQTTRVEVPAIHKDGSQRWLEMMLVNFEHLTGTRGFIVNIRDITDRRGVVRELRRQAFRDSLTGLPNRLAFQKRLQKACAQIGGETTVAVLFLDLDRFKTINDWMGHDGGDQALVAVGQRISDTLQPGEMVARLGGDEYAVLIEDANPASAMSTASRILLALARPVPVLHRRLSIEASIGLAVSDDVPGQGDSLLRAADIAQHRAKASGGAIAVIFEEPMYSEVLRQIEMETELQAALQRNRIQPYFQPECDIHTGEIVGLEVLMRWHRHAFGLTHPDEFLPIAEETGLIAQLGEFNFRTSCQHFRSWLEAGIVPDNFYLSFNLTNRETRIPDLVETIEQILDEQKIDPARIRFEIPQHVLASSDKRRLSTIMKLDQLGAKLTIDQFGSGPSSLSLFEDLPVTGLKLDRDFRAKALRIDPEGDIERYLVKIATRLNVQVTMIGVESQEHLNNARATGYQCAQGHYLSPPLPAPEIRSLLGSAWSPRPEALLISSLAQATA